MIAERVGLILTDGQVIELANISPTPENSFSVEPEAMIQYEDQIAATWHTHPTTSARLSGEDYIGFTMWPYFVHYIFGQDDLRAYIVEKGTVLNYACENHPSWCAAKALAEQLRVRSQHSD